MIDKSKQLVIRVDLYFVPVLIAALVISICELPLLALWIELARYFISIGWLLLLSFAIKTMLKAKIEHQLTSDLQIYKIVVLFALIAMSSALVWTSVTDLGPAQTSQFGLVVKLVILLNVMATADVYAIGIL